MRSNRRHFIGANLPYPALGAPPRGGVTLLAVLAGYASRSNVVMRAMLHKHRDTSLIQIGVVGPALLTVVPQDEVAIKQTLASRLYDSPHITVMDAWNHAIIVRKIEPL